MNTMSLSQIYTFMFLSAFKFNMFMGFWGLGFWGFGFRVQGLGCKV